MIPAPLFHPTRPPKGAVLVPFPETATVAKLPETLPEFTPTRPPAISNAADRDGAGGGGIVDAPAAIVLADQATDPKGPRDGARDRDVGDAAVVKPGETADIAEAGDVDVLQAEIA